MIALDDPMRVTRPNLQLFSSPFASLPALGEAWPLVAPSMAAAHGVSFLPQSVATSPLSAGKDRSVQALHAGVDASGGATSRCVELIIPPRQSANLGV